MRKLGPDDYNAGKMVTVTAGPFCATQSPFPPGMFGQNEPPKQEDKSLHGRVFKIIVYDPPFVILEPLDRLGDVPPVQQSGPFAMIPYGGNYVPDAIKLNTSMGVTLAEVSTEYALAYQQHFCPPKQPQPQHPSQQLRQPPQQPKPGGPITRMLENNGNDCDCDHCDKRGQCKFEGETRHGE